MSDSRADSRTQGETTRLAAAHTNEFDHLLLSLEGLLAASGRQSRRSSIKWWHSGDSFRPGELRSNRRGAGFDLDSIGPWQEGDDFRHIDWAASARSGRTQVQRFKVEVESRVILAIDLRASMFFGTQTQLMAQTAVLASSRLAWSLSTNHQLFGLTILHEQGTIYNKPERGRRARLQQFQQLVEAHNQRLVASRPDSTATDNRQSLSLAEGLQKMPTQLPRDAEIIIVSDFSDAGSGLQQWCQHHDPRRMTAVIVEDDLFSVAPPAALYPSQSTDGQRLMVRIAGGKQVAYHDAVTGSRSQLQKELRDYGIRQIVSCDANSVSGGGLRQ